MNQHTNKPSNSGEITFTCPVLIEVTALRAEVAELKKVLVAKAPATELLDNSDLMCEYHISRSTASLWRSKGLSYNKVGLKIYYTRENINDFLKKYKHLGF